MSFTPSPFQISISIEVDSLNSSTVDACFEDETMSFLQDASVLTSPALHEVPDEGLDLELGLLESVQEIAILMARTSPARAQHSLAEGR
jgi:hypothetical protein